ncbi:MAG: NAD(P)H-binding protein [Flavobacteriales bacterium]|nr:NAD(P)H-binding protein [Flavobacteriales bacterium]
MTPRTAILLGASGSVGEDLLAELERSTAFDRIIVLARKPLNQQHGPRTEVGLVPKMSPSGLEQAVVDALRTSNAEAIGFSVLGVGAGTAKLSLEEHRAVDVELNAAFARGLKASGKVRHLLLMSAIGADANASTRGGAAGTPRYSRVKGEAEVAVKAQGPVVVSIFRPAMILGSKHTPGVLAAIIPLFKALTPVRFRSIRTTEIAQAMVAAALRHPGTSEVYSYPEMMRLIGKG